LQKGENKKQNNGGTWAKDENLSENMAQRRRFRGYAVYRASANTGGKDYGWGRGEGTKLRVRDTNKSLTGSQTTTKREDGKPVGRPKEQTG